MNYQLTLESNKRTRDIEVRGTIKDEEWQDRQRAAQVRYDQRAPAVVHRVGRRWVK